MEPHLTGGKSAPSKSFFERLSSFLLREPEDRVQLLEILHTAHERSLFDAEALSMMEGVLQVSTLSARDVMIPRAQMDVMDLADTVDDMVRFAVSTAHSRFPVIEGGRDDVIGILLAKDLLRHQTQGDFEVRDMLRPAVFIPESKPLNVLLRDFRSNRNHVAIVVDEYGGVAGMVTMEDVLEQIVGDIEDEYDFDDEADNILLSEPGDDSKGLAPVYRVRGLTEIQQFNEVFGTQLSDEDADTIGGLVVDTFGRVPRRGEHTELQGWVLEVLRADPRQLHVLRVKRATTVESDAAA